MTNEKAIKCLKKSLCYEIDVCKDGFCKDDCAIETAIEALEKQIPKKPFYEGDGYDEDGEIIYDIWRCPNCDESYEYDYDIYDHCPNCGQAIDWSEGEQNDKS